jgi:7-keto-8-aminopelargonate synthetase-like enzyme
MVNEKVSSLKKFLFIQISIMSKTQSFYETIDQVVTYGIEKRILHLYTSDVPFNGTQIEINGRKVLNFGSCSYLGLEFDKRLKEGAKNAIDKYGTQFSESRAYVSLGIYRKLEQLLEEIFDASCVVVPTTTLGHIASIPVVVEDDHAVILDQQVHNSVQTAVQLVKARGVHIELVRHNRMDLLEERIKELSNKFSKVWYMADGIYSMFGDCTPVETIFEFLQRYPKFNFYVDDAHGMSIHGPHGRGYVLAERDIHPKMILATSLNKAFASGGGALVFGNPELARKVGTVGGPLLSSGPMQPSGVGAAIAAARIHLSDEIIEMQERLKDNIRFASLLIKKFHLPIISEPGAAIFFIGVSLPKLGHNVVRRMLDRGYYVNLGVFPTVPMKKTGIRFTITRLHTFSEIEGMISALAEELPKAMKEENITFDEIYKAFRIPLPNEISATIKNAVSKETVTLEHFETIHQISKEAWNKIFEGKGSFDWNGLALLEKAFSGNERCEDNWRFDYFLIKDNNGKILVATFFTTALWKDDMLSPASVSEQVEAKRKVDPYYLTGKVVCSGSLITEGEHLYCDFESPKFKEAMQLLFKHVYEMQDSVDANHIVFRDFHSLNEQLDHLMVDNGFFRINMPEAYEINDLTWKGKGEYFQSLSLNSKRHLTKKVFRHFNRFKVEVIEGKVGEKELDHWYRLYKNVKEKSFELNTYALPRKLFSCICENEYWEVLRLTIEDVYLEGQACCVVFCYKSGDAYIPMIIGLDYTFNKQFGIYRQALYRLILRAKELGKSKVMLGFSAGIEKKKLGAKEASTYAYMHIRDTFDLEVLSSFSAKEAHGQ